MTDYINGKDAILTGDLAESKGDIFVSGGSNQIQRLGVGTDGQALVADSTAASGLSWGGVSADGIDADSLTNAKMSPTFGPLQTATFLYSFATLGGATGAITLTDTAGAAQTLADNSVIFNCWVEGITTATSSGSATIKLGFTGNDDAFMPVTAYNNGEFTSDIVTIAGNELPLKLTAAVSVLATVATAALTAGVFRVHIEYREGA